MTSHRPHFIIVGAGMAGGYAADALRKHGFDGRITLLGAEPHRPYDRPPLSKEFLRAEKSVDKLFFRPEDHFQEQQIDLVLGTRAAALRPQDHSLTLADGTNLNYDKILLCTGGAVRRVAVDGHDLEGIYYLRTLDDSVRLREALQKQPRVVVVGAGFIGSEVVATARHYGCEVTCLELEQTPLLRVLGAEVGNVYADIQRDHGVTMCLGDGLAAFRGTGNVEEVLTTSGTSLPCDIAVVGVGIRPDVDWLLDSGIALQNGVLTNEFCEASAPDVYAAGDLANWYHPRTKERLRVEHWDNAMNQGVAAAMSMLGKKEPYGPVPYFWSDQYDINLQYVGHAATWDHVVLRGDVAGRTFSAFYLRDGRIAGALVVNRFKDLRPSRRLIEAMTPVPAEALADEATDLRKLAASVNS